MNRRSFLKLPALLPLIDFGSAFRSEEHHFQYESVIGTSLDLDRLFAFDSRVAEGACQTVREEIDRLASILDTRDPASEISLLEGSNDRRDAVSQSLTDVLDAYEYWERRTGGVLSIRPGGADTPRNVDALGKAYIIDRAAAAARKAWPSIDALLLNIGGDIVMWGRSCEIAIADPGAWYDNARPIATIDLRNAAVATSGTYARGAHLIDSRSGQSHGTLRGRDGRRCRCGHRQCARHHVVPDQRRRRPATRRIDARRRRRCESRPVSCSERRVLRFWNGRFQPPSRPRPRNWPPDTSVTMTLPLTATPFLETSVCGGVGGGLIRQAGSRPGDLGREIEILCRSFDALGSPSRKLQSIPIRHARHAARRANTTWSGTAWTTTASQCRSGTYRITVETNQEHGTYAKQTGTITVGDSPTSITLPATTNFDAVVVRYGPK